MRNQGPQIRNYRDQQSCAHAWAHQLTAGGNASNFFFDVATIYSYGTHFPIATLDGERVFFTTLNYSVSTAAHKRLVRSAISHKEIIYVQHLPVNDEQITASSTFVKQNINFWTDSIANQTRNFLQNPRKTSLLKSIAEQLNLLQALIDTFNEEAPRTFHNLMESSELKQATELIAVQRTAQENRAGKRNASRLAAFEKSALEWESGFISTLKITHPIDPNLCCLRLSADQQHIETSKGIKIPIQQARQFWMYIRRMAGSTGIKPAYSIAGFQVQEIRPEFIRVGCHTIPMLQVNKIATQLDWISMQV